MSHRRPTRPGHYWAKLVSPTRMPEGEDWRSVHWETVEVFDNGGEGRESLKAHVPGIAKSQYLEDFVWGPLIPEYKGE